MCVCHIGQLEGQAVQDRVQIEIFGLCFSGLVAQQGRHRHRQLQLTGVVSPVMTFFCKNKCLGSRCTWSHSSQFQLFIHPHNSLH